MWILLIINTVVGLDELKVTRYAEFETAMSCHIEQAVVETTFTQGDQAMCKKEK